MNTIYEEMVRMNADIVRFHPIFNESKIISEYTLTEVKELKSYPKSGRTYYRIVHGIKVNCDNGKLIKPDSIDTMKILQSERDQLHDALSNLIAVVDFNMINKTDNDYSWKDGYIKAKIVLDEVKRNELLKEYMFIECNPIGFRRWAVHGG